MGDVLKDEVKKALGRAVAQKVAQMTGTFNAGPAVKADPGFAGQLGSRVADGVVDIATDPLAPFTAPIHAARGVAGVASDVYDRVTGGGNITTRPVTRAAPKTPATATGDDAATTGAPAAPPTLPGGGAAADPSMGAGAPAPTTPPPAQAAPATTPPTLPGGGAAADPSMDTGAAAPTTQPAPVEQTAPAAETPTDQPQTEPPAEDAPTTDTPTDEVLPEAQERPAPPTEESLAIDDMTVDGMLRRDASTEVTADRLAESYAGTQEALAIRDRLIQQGVESGAFPDAGAASDYYKTDEGLREVFGTAMVSSISDKVNNNDLAGALGDSFRMIQIAEKSEGDGATQLAEIGDVAIDAVRERLAVVSQDWSNEDWANFRKQVVTDSMPEGVLEMLGPEAAEEAFGAILENKVTTQRNEVAEAVIDNPQGSGFMDWMTSNWQQLLVPAGLVAFAFGGTPGKILGGLAMAYGGWNLYGRYRNLTQDPTTIEDPARRAEVEAVRGAVAEAMQQQTQDGQRSPFADAAAAFDDYVGRRLIQARMDGMGQDELLAMAESLEQHRASAIQGVRDARLLAGIGFTDSLVSAANEQANRVFQGIWGPDRQIQPYQSPQ